MYFEAFTYDGTQCRDGGLKANNPLQVAVNESKAIWGEGLPYDMILSVGSGSAQNPPKEPSSSTVIPSWLTSLFATLMTTMNGQQAWRQFSKNADPRLLNRTARLNVEFQTSREPLLDDTDSLDLMEGYAKGYRFPKQPLEDPHDAFRPTYSRRREIGIIDNLADRLRASLYFVELDSVTEKKDVFIIKGWICCRIGPERAAFQNLLKATTSFKQASGSLTLQRVRRHKPLKLGITIQQPASHHLDPIRLDVSFGREFVTISGFPATLDVSIGAATYDDRAFEGEDVLTDMGMTGIEIPLGLYESGRLAVGPCGLLRDRMHSDSSPKGYM